MDLETFAKVGRGDIIRQRGQIDPFIVHQADGQCIRAVSLVVVRDVAEWGFARTMVIEELSALTPGLQICRISGDPLFTVTSTYVSFVHAVRTVVITASEADAWVLTHKAVLVPQRSD